MRARLYPSLFDGPFLNCGYEHFPEHQLWISEAFRWNTRSGLAEPWRERDLDEPKRSWDRTRRALSLEVRTTSPHGARCAAFREDQIAATRRRGSFRPTPARHRIGRQFGTAAADSPRAAYALAASTRAPPPPRHQETTAPPPTAPARGAPASPIYARQPYPIPIPHHLSNVCPSTT